MIFSQQQRYFFTMLAIVFFDRLSKSYVIMHVKEVIVFNPFISFCLSYNRGISWGILHSDNCIVFTVVTALIIGVISWLMIDGYRQFKKGRFIWHHVFLLSGACSNIIDRFLYGGVADFIIISYQKWVWPSFNVADISIVFGAMLMFIAVIIENEL
jgi:signal peptidase II